jgi:serine/threonine protein kinase
MAAPHASYRWMAPELFNSKTVGLLENRFSEVSDIYAFAMLFMEVLLRFYPSIANIYINQIFTGQVPFCELPTDVEDALATMQGL